MPGTENEINVAQIRVLIRLAAGAFDFPKSMLILSPLDQSNVAKRFTSLGIIQTDRRKTFAILGPFGRHAHKEEKVHAPLKQLFELGARGSADLLHLRPALAEHDRFLALALDMDDLADLDAAIRALFPLLGLDSRRIGQLLMQLEIELLACDLGGEQPLRQIG